MIRVFQVDAFAKRPFAGNPAGVCVLDESRPESWMQSFATEMNLSETAFLLKQNNGFGLRWFTPTTEVGLCGHATLAAAHILWEEKYIPEQDMAAFHTKSGLLVAKKSDDWIEMDFPARFVEEAKENPELNRALKISPKRTSKISSAKGEYYLIEIGSEEEVRSVSPDFDRLASTGIREVIVTSKSTSKDIDFVSRFFAPLLGIDEDPVTGSAHCYLAPYWGTLLNKKTMLGLQVSKRSGLVGCKWEGDRVILRGQAVTIFRGELVA